MDHSNNTKYTDKPGENLFKSVEFSIDLGRGDRVIEWYGECECTKCKCGRKLRVFADHNGLIPAKICWNCFPVCSDVRKTTRSLLT